MGHAGDGTHPNFHNFLKLGGDPLMDMGPYYLTALVNLLGPVRRVTGSAGQLHKEVTVHNPKSTRYGDTVPVEAPTNVTAVLDFHNGAIASLQAAKESFGYKPRLEIFGTEGNMTVPDPNFFWTCPWPRQYNPHSIQHRTDKGASALARIYRGQPGNRSGRYGLCGQNGQSSSGKRPIGSARSGYFAEHFLKRRYRRSMFIFNPRSSVPLRCRWASSTTSWINRTLVL